MKEIKCPHCATWYEVDPAKEVTTYICTACDAPYKVITEEEQERKEAMANPVSTPPLKWKRFGDAPWPLVILNNIAFVFQTIIFMIGTIIGVLLAPL